MTENPTHNDDSESSWLSDLSDAAVPPAEGSAAQDVPDLPRIERPRVERAPLVPVWVKPTIVIALAVIVFAVITGITLRNLSEVAVPDVTGASLGVARTRLAQAGLEVEVTERRFSSRPEDEVLVQSPQAGAELPRGEAVSLIVSAGSEEFAMPDVVGDGLQLAQGELESRGLIVVLEPVISDAASSTVLATTPSAGAIVRTGDSVRLQIAAPRAPGVTLQPYQLNGVSVLIDPASQVEGAPDAAMGVARRLRALLEASGARVEMLRSGNETQTTVSSRARRASEVTSTVAVGLRVASKGDPGRRVSTFESTPTVPGAVPGIAAAIATELKTVAPPVSLVTTASDQVLQAARAPWARVTLGSATSRPDTTSFEDPQWADAVARAIYTAIGKVYGVKPTP